MTSFLQQPSATDPDCPRTYLEGGFNCRLFWPLSRRLWVLKWAFLGALNSCVAISDVVVKQNCIKHCMKATPFRPSVDSYLVTPAPYDVTVVRSAHCRYFM